jgi:hypothetical protein
VAAKSSDDFLSKCACATDLELCSAIVGGVEDKYGYARLTEPHPGVPVHEFVPYLVWSGQGFAAKEGLRCALAAQFDKAGWADAYDLIGLSHLAESLRLLIARLPDPFAPYDDAELDTYLQDLSAECEEAESILFAADNENQVVPLVALYIRRQIDQYEGFASFLDPPREREFGNIGYLRSVHHWIANFAGEHAGRIPTFEELRETTMHHGLKRAPSALYTIALAGLLAEQPSNAPLVILERPLFGRRYCVTVVGDIQQMPESL